MGHASWLMKQTTEARDAFDEIIVGFELAALVFPGRKTVSLY